MMKAVLKTAFIISIFICFILFLNTTDVNDSIRLIKQLGAGAFSLLLVTFSSYLFGTMGWKYCIESEKKLLFSRLFLIRHTGNTITLFNPASAVAGEIYNARMLIDHGICEQNAYRSVLLARILMAFSQLFLFFIVLIWFFVFLSHRLDAEMLLWFYAISFILFLFFLSIVYLLLKRWEEIKVDPEVGKWKKIISRIKEMRFLLAEYIRRRPKETSIAFLFFSLQWIFGSLELFFILYFLKYSITVWDSLFLDTSIILLKSIVSFVPGQLGVEELINKFGLHLIGIDSPNLWLSVSILRRLRQLFWSGVALLFYLKLKKTKNSKTEKTIILES